MLFYLTLKLFQKYNKIKQKNKKKYWVGFYQLVFIITF